jgi:hypothetical protein
MSAMGLGLHREDIVMTDRVEEELARVVVRDAAQRYIAGRQHQIDAFVDRHFSFLGSLALHRRAIGWDLVRAPANLLLAGPALLVKLAGWAGRRAGSRRLADRLARMRLLFDTGVSRELEWLVMSELLEIPCHRSDRASYRDALAATILADERVAERLDTEFDKLAGCRFKSAVQNYLESRSATAEIATGVAAAGFGALAVKQATPGLATLGMALAGMIAQQAAIAAFPLGAGLGGLWYGLFPVAAGPGLLAATMGSVFLSAAVLAAFSGIVTDPLQRRLGLHRRRLLRLMQELERTLGGEAGRDPTLRDHYVARLVDVFDLVALASRVSHV